MTYTTRLTRHPEATLWVHVEGECAHEAEAEDLEAFGLVERRGPETVPYYPEPIANDIVLAEGPAEDVIRDGVIRVPCGPYCAHCGGQHLGVQCRMRAAEVERDEARERCRRAAQILIAEFGSDGPLNVDEAAERAVRVARERADGLAQAVTDATAEVVERVCAAVTLVQLLSDEHTCSAANVYVGAVHVAYEFAPQEGQVKVNRIRDEIRKAAKS